MEQLVELKENNHVITADDCHVYSNRKDTIKWKNDTDTTYTIHFDVCPLTENDVSVPGKDKSKPIALKDGIPANTYAYEIRVAEGSVMAADPNVIVH